MGSNTGHTTPHSTVFILHQTLPYITTVKMQKIVLLTVLATLNTIKCDISRDPYESEILSQKNDRHGAQMPAYVKDMMEKLQKRNHQNAEQDGRFPLQKPHSSSGLTSLTSNVLKMMGYDDRMLGKMAINMVMYMGEMMANTILNTDTNNIDTEIPEYRAFSDSGDIFSIIRVALQRSSSRGDQIKTSLLDKNLAKNMIHKLQDKTGNSTSCVQLFQCKMVPIMTSAQSATNTTFNSLFGHSLQESSDLWIDLLFNNSPNQKDFETHGNKCESEYPNCPLLHYGDQTNTLY